MGVLVYVWQISQGSELSHSWVSFTQTLCNGIEKSGIYVYKILLVDYSTGSIQLSATKLMHFLFSILNFDFSIDLLYWKINFCSVVNETSWTLLLLAMSTPLGSHVVGKSALVVDHLELFSCAAGVLI